MSGGNPNPPSPSAEDGVTRVFLRPLASPMGLGFSASAVASFLLCSRELGWIPPAQAHRTAIMLIAFAVLPTFIASVFGFLARDTVVGTGMGVTGASWLAIGGGLWSGPAGTAHSLGILFVVAAAALVPPAAAAATSKLVPSLAIGTLALRWVLSGVYELTGSPSWAVAAGVAGVAVTIVSLYTAAGLELEGAMQRTVLPLLRIGIGRKAIDGPFEDQQRRIGNEPGVRRQL